MNKQSIQYQWNTIANPVSNITLREKCPNTECFSGPYFPAFGLNTERYVSPNTGKYGPGKTPYLETFHAVLKTKIKPDLHKNLHD